MNSDQPKYAAIGLSFSFDIFERLSGVLADKKFGVAGEGSGATGFEIYVIRDHAEEAVELIQSSPELKDVKIELYKRIRDFDDGTRYDRLADHLDGEDPDRPAITGVRIEL